MIALWPICRLVIATSSALVDLPSRGTDEVNRTTCGGRSTFEKRMLVRRLRTASASADLGASRNRRSTSMRCSRRPSMGSAPSTGRPVVSASSRAERKVSLSRSNSSTSPIPASSPKSTEASSVRVRRVDSGRAGGSAGERTRASAVCTSSCSEVSFSRARKLA